MPARISTPPVASHRCRRSAGCRVRLPCAWPVEAGLYLSALLRSGRTSISPWAVRYHVLVHELAERVLGDIRREELLRAGDRVGIAVSGGIDSVALLRVLLELRHDLGIVISVLHFNHKLRGAESEGDQEFVAGLALEHSLEFHASSGDVAQLAAVEHSCLEAAARGLRYGFFRILLDVGVSEEPGERALTKIASGHT